MATGKKYELNLPTKEKPEEFDLFLFKQQPLTRYEKRFKELSDAETVEKRVFETQRTFNYRLCLTDVTPISRANISQGFRVYNTEIYEVTYSVDETFPPSKSPGAE